MGKRKKRPDWVGRQRRNTCNARIWYNEGMTQREQVIQLLQAHRQELAAIYGVRSLALFGSLARNEATEQSDVDLVVEFDRAVGYFGLVALQEHLANLLHRSVDLGTLHSLKPRIRRQVEQDLIHVL
jgi:predicted nucleotidyltransferase